MSEQDPSLDAVQEQRLRALLAALGSGAAGESDRLPPEVATRLEDTLAGLVAEREAARVSEEHTATGEVVPLRPRWMPRVAAAAAAVIVLGLGALTAANLARHDESATTADAGAGSGSAKAEQAPSAAGGKTFTGPTLAAAGELRSATFAQDVRVLLAHSPTLRAPARVQGQLSGPTPTQGTTSGSAACPGPPNKDGSSTTVVRLDAAPAALVVHPAGKGRQRVEAWSCDGTRRLASTTVAP